MSSQDARGTGKVARAAAFVLEDQSGEPQGGVGEQRRDPSLASANPVRLRFWAAGLAALAGGKLLDLAGPDMSGWFLALPAVALIAAAVWQQRPGVGALAGALAGFAFWGPHISWLTLYLGPIPWSGLTAVMTAWFTLFGLAAAIATRGLGRLAGRGEQAGRGASCGPVRVPVGVLVAAQALAFAGLWVAREQVQGAWPYGGFAWGRLAHTQADGPLAQAVSWLGFAGLSGALALACSLPVAALFARSSRDRTVAAGARVSAGARPRPAVGASAAAVALLAILVLLPPASLTQTGELRVAAVQGNSKSAIFDDRENGSVLADHLAATDELLDRLEESGDSVDLIVWPENSAEFELRENVLGGLRVQELARRAGAPIVVGSVLRDPDGSYTNSTLVWDEDGEVAGQRYDKRFPVPFAEYMPNRDFFHAIVPDLVDLVQLEYDAGERSPVLQLDTQAGAVHAGIAICFDIIFDDQAVRMVGDGAEVILAQTNNADFGRTDESAQQLAIARLRAIETGRSVVNISTVGTSALVAPDGRDLDRLEPFTADALLGSVQLVDGKTPALVLGAWIAGAWVTLGVLGLCVGAAVSARDTRRGRCGTAATPPPLRSRD